MKVVILGGAAKKRYFRHDPKAEYWICNGQWLGARLSWFPPPDRAFNLHKRKLLELYSYDFSRETEWVKQNPDVPFYTMDKWPRCKTTLFPVKEMARMPRGMYHCGSFDWMVAFAVREGATRIELHGIGLCLEAGEPISSRACLEYWCGYAEGRGIKVTTAPDCDFFHFYHLVKSRLVYGLDDTPIYEDRTKKGVPYDYKD